MAKTCCVCSDSKESAENRLFRCGGQGCGIIVHQGWLRSNLIKHYLLVLFINYSYNMDHV